MRSFTLAAVVVGLLALTGCQSRQKNLTVREENVGRQSLCLAAKEVLERRAPADSVPELAIVNDEFAMPESSQRARFVVDEVTHELFYGEWSCPWLRVIFQMPSAEPGPTPRMTPTPIS